MFNKHMMMGALTGGPSKVARLCLPCQGVSEPGPPRCCQWWAASAQPGPGANRFHRCPKLIPTPDSCRRVFFFLLCFSVFSSTWGNPEVGGGDQF